MEDRPSFNFHDFTLSLLYLPRYRLLQVIAVRYQRMIHEECGRPLHSAPMAGQHITPYFQHTGSCMQVVLKVGYIQSGHRGIEIEIIYFEMRLILEQHIMHGPETVLQSGGFRGFRGKLRMRMFLGQRKVPVHEPHMVGESNTQSAYEKVRLAAMRTFKIAVGNDGNRCRPVPHHMIVRQHEKVISITRVAGRPRHRVYTFRLPPLMTKERFFLAMCNRFNILLSRTSSSGGMVSGGWNRYLKNIICDMTFSIGRRREKRRPSLSVL